MILLLILVSFCAQAQTLERQAIGSAGTFQTVSWGSLSSATGESVIATSTTSSLVLTQGFQQPSQTDLAVYDVPAGIVL